MTCIPFPDEGFQEKDLKDLQRLRAMEHERHVLSRMARSTPLLNKAAIAVEARWADLPREYREVVCDLAEAIDREFFSLPPPRDAVDLVRGIGEAIWISLHRPTVLRFSMALLRFQSAVGAARAADRRRSVQAWAQAVDAPGFSDAPTRPGQRLTKEEFLARFS